MRRRFRFPFQRQMLKTIVQEMDGSFIAIFDRSAGPITILTDHDPEPGQSSGQHVGLVTTVLRPSRGWEPSDTIPPVLTRLPRYPPLRMIGW